MYPGLSPSFDKISQPSGTRGCFVVVVGFVSGFSVVVGFGVCLVVVGFGVCLVVVVFGVCLDVVGLGVCLVVVVFGVCLDVVGFGVGLAVVDCVTGEVVGFGVGRTLTSSKMQLTSDADIFSL